MKICLTPPRRRREHEDIYGQVMAALAAELGLPETTARPRRCEPTCPTATPPSRSMRRFTGAAPAAT
jgi:hypothetical protein